MRLYLSSFRLGNRPQALTDLAGANKRALVVANTCDTFAEPERSPRVTREIDALQGLGFAAEELDLRDYFGGQKSDELRRRLSGAGLVWVRGGNAFVYRRALRQSGCDGILADLLARDTLVYGGYSGGIAVLAPSLRGIEIVNDPHALPAGYDPAVPWDGLGILPYYVAPHYRGSHFASADMEKVIRYFIDHHMLFRALRDGEAIVIDGASEAILS